MKATFILFFSLAFLVTRAQPSKPTVLTLATFHFDFPNLDVVQISKNDQIDVLDPKYQNEIAEIVQKILKFKPTIIAIERHPNAQWVTDSTFNQYIQNKYALARCEEEQIGFRIAKQMGLTRLYCVNAWGNFNDRIARIVYGKDSVEAKKFESYFEKNPDSSKRVLMPIVFKKAGILATLRQVNDETNIKKDLGNYLIGLFKYESKPNDFLGVDFETGRWFSRNLKIFRNIQRIPAGPSDRILVIFGAGHMNILNYLFDCSPEYNRVHTNDYLK